MTSAYISLPRPLSDYATQQASARCRTRSYTSLCRFLSSVPHTWKVRDARQLCTPRFPPTSLVRRLLKMFKVRRQVCTPRYAPLLYAASHHACGSAVNILLRVM